MSNMSRIREAVEQYAAGAGQLAEAIAGLSDAELNAFPVPGTWSIRQIALHLLDSDLVASDRMRRVIAMDTPLLMGYDETRFSQRLHYEKMDIHTSCEMFRLNRLMTAKLLHLLSEDDFSRAGVHSERGKLTLLELVHDYVRHLAHHMKFIVEKRKLLGKPAK
jgi:uncharacterized damage-inducible protein DinB